MSRLATSHLQNRFVVGLNPVGETVAEIHQRVSQRGHLPIENADRASGVLRVEHDVVEAKIAMDHAGPNVVTDVLRKPLDYFFIVRDVLGSGTTIPVGPSLDLSSNITLSLSDCGQWSPFNLDLMELDQLVDGGRDPIRIVRPDLEKIRDGSEFDATLEKTGIEL